MPDTKTGFERLWRGCDNLLLLTVAVLLAVWFVSSRQSDVALLKAEDVATDVGKEPPHPPRRTNVSAGRAVESLRVSLEQARMNTIARSMVESAWECVPACPAMDMRDDGTRFEILFALPEGTGAEQVQVSAKGGILTLALTSPADGSVVLKRFRVPCGAERPEKIETAISNDVIRVLIHP
jgi:HSP20 family molecular chaperone IbpA